MLVGCCCVASRSSAAMRRSRASALSASLCQSTLCHTKRESSDAGAGYSISLASSSRVLPSGMPLLLVATGVVASLARMMASALAVSIVAVVSTTIGARRDGATTEDETLNASSVSLPRAAHTHDGRAHSRAHFSSATMRLRSRSDSARIFSEASFWLLR